MEMEDRFDRAPAADRIKQARIRSGLSAQDICRSLQMEEMSFFDFETYDDDAFKCVSLLALCSFADLTGVQPQDLVAPVGAPAPRPVPMARVIELIVAQTRERSETVESFSKRVGWDVSSALANEQDAWRDWNVDCLQDVSSSVGLRWLDVLSSWPGRHAV